PSSGPRRALPSFPTRRSSDLGATRGQPPRRRLTDSGTRGGGHERDPSVELGRHAHAPRRLLRQHRNVPACSTKRRLTNWNRSPKDRKSTRLNSSHLGISYAVF